MIARYYNDGIYFTLLQRSLEIGSQNFIAHYIFMMMEQCIRNMPLLNSPLPLLPLHILYLLESFPLLKLHQICLIAHIPILQLSSCCKTTFK